MSFRKVVIIGSGNLANHIGKYLLKKNVSISQVVSRNKLSSVSLAKKLNSIADQSIDQIVKKADAYFLCVNDDSIKIISTQLTRLLSNDKVIIHCSGSKTLDELDQYFLHRAVIWPLQSFANKSKIEWSQIPFFTESTHSIHDTIQEFCKEMNWNSIPVNSEKKRLIHIAAVFANNFSNFNLIVAQEILAKCNLPLEVLKPIVESGLDNVFVNGPVKGQTGPARRGDSKVIQSQIKELSNHFPHLKEVYKEYSQLIMDYFKTQSKS